jgi:hypothetical protein
VSRQKTSKNKLLNPLKVPNFENVTLFNNNMNEKWWSLVLTTPTVGTGDEISSA